VTQAGLKTPKLNFFGLMASLQHICSGFLLLIGYIYTSFQHQILFSAVHVDVNYNTVTFRVKVEVSVNVS